MFPDDYITQVSEKIEGKVTKKLSEEFSKTENRMLGALSRLDFLPTNKLIQVHSGTAPETSQNAYGINEGPNEDDSQSGPHPEAGICHNETKQNFGPGDEHDNNSFDDTINAATFKPGLESPAVFPHFRGNIL